MKNNVSDKVISVIVACYNPDLEKLKNTIISILNQENANYEIVISDDGSAVEYKSELEQWLNDNRIENVILNFLPNNVGTVKNILSACYLCKGEYVKTISPGDYLYDKHSLSNYLRVFDKKNADIVFGKAQYYTTDGKLLSNSAPANKALYKNLFIKSGIICYQDWILGATVAAKKETEIEYLTKIENRIKFLEDIPLTTLALLEKRRVVASKKYLVWYEFGEGISTSEGKKSILDDDYDAFFSILNEEYPCRKVKIANKIYQTRDIGQKMKAFFCKVRISPFYFIYRLFQELYKCEKNKSNIDDINKIISLKAKK